MKANKKAILGSKPSGTPASLFNTTSHSPNSEKSHFERLSENVKYRFWGMTAKLIEVGRGKVTKTVEVKNKAGLLQEVRRHLMSSEVELTETDDDGTCEVIVGGFRTVGKVKILTP